jgi:hypothetical protein
MIVGYKRKEAIRLVTERQHAIADLVSKVVIYRDTKYVNHWCDELSHHLKHVRGGICLKKGGRLDEHAVFDLLYDQPLGRVVKRHSMMYELFVQMPHEIPTGTSFDLLPAFHRLIAFIYGGESITAGTVHNTLLRALTK